MLIGLVILSIFVTYFGITKIHTLLTVPVEIKPASINIGQIAQGSIVSNTVFILNSSDVPLTIEGVQTSCGCTTTSPLNKIAPHGTVPLEIKFDSHGKVGNVNKIVVLTIAGHSDKPVTIPLSAYIVQEVSTLPTSISMGILTGDSIRSAKVIITRCDGKRLEVLDVHSPSNIHTQLKRLASNVIQLTARVSNNNLLGKFQDEINIRTNHLTAPEMIIPISYERLGNYQIEPTQINFGIVYEKQESEINVQIKGADVAHFTVTSTPPGMTVTLSNQSETQCILKASFTPKGGKHIIQSKIILRTHDLVQREIVIPVYAATL